MQERMGVKLGPRSSIATVVFMIALTGTLGCGQDRVPAWQPPSATSVGASMTGQAGQGAKGSNSGGVKKPKPSDPAEDEGELDQDGGVNPTVGETGLRADGDHCTDGDECASGHCNNELCCADGDCCIETSDCANGGATGNVCDYHATCQGTRGKVSCQGFRCGTDDGAPNDTACNDDVEAKDCGPYKSVFCNGKSEQQAPTCADSCTSDDECDKDARCIDKVCKLNESVPKSCTSNATCPSGQTCQSGKCGRPATAGTGGAGAEASASCLESLGNDRCSECACSKCENTATACWDSGEAQRDTLCKAVLECALPQSCINPNDCAAPTFPGPSAGGAGAPGGVPMADYAYGCFGRECYCGSDCLTGPRGPCAQQIEAAAGNSTVTTEISARRRNPQYALYYAEQHAQCLQRSCRSECGL